MLIERKRTGIAISFEKEECGCTIKMEKWNRRKGTQEAEISIRLFQDEIDMLLRWLAIELEQERILLGDI